MDVNEVVQCERELGCPPFGVRRERTCSYWNVSRDFLPPFFKGFYNESFEEGTWKLLFL